MPLFHVCFPGLDPDEWFERSAETAARAAAIAAEQRCILTADHRRFYDGVRALVREDGHDERQRFEVVCELVPAFHAEAL